jgi:uracil phosphoribosyltransferase|nr:MAG: uracil phosphoribosyltransferase [Bacteroidota bacterium]
MENLTIIQHALIQRNLTLLRDRRTPHGEFRRLLHQTASLLAYEVLRDLPVRAVEIETPLEPTVGYVLDTEVVVVPILRAGLGMVDGFVQYLPEARIGHLGIYRDEATHRPVDYYAKLPPGLERAWVIVIDPMLATGGSADDALSSLKARGARQLRFVCLVAAPEGVRRLADRHPDVRLYAAALDRELNRHAFILPGLGDAGDRVFGT